jgi:hypothetical protein
MMSELLNPAGSTFEVCMAFRAARSVQCSRWIAVSLLVFAFVSSAQAGNPKSGKQKPLPAGSASASAQPPAGPVPLAQSLSGQAKADYDAARLLYADGDFAGALVKFSSAYDQSHDPRLLWNMGACEKNLRHYAKVLTLVRRYQAEGGALLTEQDHQEARTLASTVEAFTAQLKLTVNEPGASVFIDDESIGVTPLPAPVIVDIGTRRLKVEKAGFVTYQQQVSIGGSREVPLDVQLAKQVHEGKLTVKTEPGASITIDGKPVGSGSWSGSLGSGGHALAVKAPGTLPYQSEVVIQDGETRVVDVALTRLPAQTPQAAPREPPTGSTRFETGLRSGYGRVLDPKGSSGFIPIWLDVGLRRNRITHFSAYFQYAPYDRSDQCGVDRHGPDPQGPGDLQPRYGYSECWHVAGGIQFLFHILPSLKVDPWLGFDLGAQYSVRKYTSFDPLSTQSGTGKDGGPSASIGAQLGVDIRPWKGFSVGPFGRVGALVGGDLLRNGTRDDVGLWPQLIFGLRAGYLF